MPRRVLFVAYAFPPTGGAGVQRTVKFVKYLPQFGWHASVLTVANPSVPLHDQSLHDDIPVDTVIRSARTWEPGYALKAAVSDGKEGRTSLSGRFKGLLKGAARRLSTWLLQPDAQVLWLPEAVRAGQRLLRELPHDAIVVTGPPFSSFLIGATLSKRTGLPLVLDYRDEWDISNAYWENKRLGPVSRRLQARMQARVVRSASALVATTHSSAEALGRVRSRAHGRAQLAWIYNGFDPDDFAGPPPVPAGDSVYRLAYVGTLWNLTDVSPLVEAVLRLGREQPALASRLELVFAGRRTPPQQQVLDRLQGSPCRLVQHPYLDHHAALDLIRTADGLCVLLTDGPAAERVVPAKLFEYMATRNPILVIAPRGEVWELLRDYPAAHLCPPADIEGLSATLAGEIQRHLEGKPPPAANGWDSSLFDRRNQARQLADLLNTLA